MSDACPVCDAIPPIVHEESTGPVEIPHLRSLEPLVDDDPPGNLACPRCGAVYAYREWQPGGSEDFQVTYNNAKLERLSPLVGYDTACVLFEQQRLEPGFERRLPWCLRTQRAPWATALVVEAAAWLRDRHAIRYDHPHPDVNEAARRRDLAATRRLAAAIARFCPHASLSADDRRALEQLATDPDPEVRAAAGATALDPAPLFPVGVPIPDSEPGDRTPLFASDHDGTPPGFTWAPLPDDCGLSSYSPIAIDQDGAFVAAASHDGRRQRIGLVAHDDDWRLERPAARQALVALSRAIVSPTIAVATCQPLSLELISSRTGALREAALPALTDIDRLADLAWLGPSSLIGLVAHQHLPLSTYVIVDASTGTTLSASTGVRVTTAVPSPDGSCIALHRVAPGVPACIEVIDARTGARQAKLDAPTSPALAWSRDGARLFICGNTLLGCVEATSGRPLWQARDDYVSNARLRLSPDGALVACFAGSRGFTLRDAATGAVVVRRGIAHRKPPVDMVWAHDQSALFTCGSDAMLRAWCARTGVFLAEVRYPRPTEPRWLWAASSRPLVVGSPASGRLALWQIDALAR